MRRKDIKTTIKNHFFQNPTEKLRVREIERKLNLPLPSVIRYTNELTKENILETENIGKTRFYKASRNNYYKSQKMLYNIKTIKESGLINYLKQELSNPTIILFGSYSKGEDTENSDIDIYIETPSKKQINPEKFEKPLKRTIQVFRHKSIKDIPNKNLANNILNGITLNGQIEVFK